MFLCLNEDPIMPGYWVNPLQVASAAKSLQSEELGERRYGQIYRRGAMLQCDWVTYPRSPSEMGIWTWLWLAPGQGCSLGVTPTELGQVPHIVGDPRKAMWIAKVGYHQWAGSIAVGSVLIATIWKPHFISFSCSQFGVCFHFSL